MIKSKNQRGATIDLLPQYNKDKICIHFIYFLHESKFTSIFSEYFSSCEIKGGFRLPKFGNMGLLMKTNIKCQFGWWIHMNFCVKLQTTIFVFIEVKFATKRILFCGEEAKKKRYNKREKFVISGKQALTTLNLSKTIEAWGQLKSMNWQKNCNPLLDVKFELTVGLCQFFFWFENFVGGCVRATLEFSIILCVTGFC